jgi:hypothetical protein
MSNAGPGHERYFVATLAVFAVIYRKITAVVNFLSAEILGFRGCGDNQNSGCYACSQRVSLTETQNPSMLYMHKYHNLSSKNCCFRENVGFGVEAASILRRL